MHELQIYILPGSISSSFTSPLVCQCSIFCRFCSHFHQKKSKKPFSCALFILCLFFPTAAAGRWYGHAVQRGYPHCPLHCFIFQNFVSEAVSYNFQFCIIICADLCADILLIYMSCFIVWAVLSSQFYDGKLSLISDI